MIAAILALISIATFAYFQWSFLYWSRKKVPVIRPSFPFGNMENPFLRQNPLGIWLKMCYAKFKTQGCEHGGLYNFASPVYMPVSPEHVKNIMQNHFDHFVDRGLFYNEKDDPLSAHLFNLGGQKWRSLRTKLTPSFSSGKMKIMFDTLMRCSAQMENAMDQIYEKIEPVNVKEIFACFTTDVIGSCAFGLEFNSFKDPDAEFRQHGKRIFRAMSKLKAAGQIFGHTNPEMGRFLRIKILPEDSTRFFYNVIAQTVKFRENTNFASKDMLQTLIELMNSGKNLTLQEVASQALLFFLAGFESSATTMTFCLFELAQNQEIQGRVRREIQTANRNGKVSYDSIKEMKYLEQVIDETLRKYPPVPFLSRKCVKDYKVPNSDVVIDKGTLVYLPVMGLQHDDDFFPEPEKFDPERFSPENKKLIRPFTYLPWGEGPRVCIGIRFAMLQLKVGLITLLKKYQFSLSRKTEIPLRMNCYTIMMLINETVIWLNARKVESYI